MDMVPHEQWVSEVERVYGWVTMYSGESVETMARRWLACSRPVSAVIRAIDAVWRTAGGQ